ncbi:hypothetical protein D779_3475 [Imhoffiella purpurea]|uniref:Uncharacterized protein n=1 Tax=Imhoffiella purpurea TaxID=1249627 RepID=W9VTJ8_9GAMM|nr:hypothetical protein D779_3475 [Imhoffiella purpurea]
MTGGGSGLRCPWHHRQSLAVRVRSPRQTPSPGFIMSL